MTQLASSKKSRTSWNYQSCFCAKATQAIVCGNRLPGSVKQANNGSIDLATSVLQKARPAVCVSKRNISLPRAFATAEERRRVAPQGRAATPSKPAVKGPIAGINPAHGCFSCLSPSGGRGGLSWLLTLWAFKFSGAYTAEKPWTKPEHNHFLCEQRYSHEPPMQGRTMIHVTKNNYLE